MQIPKPRKNEGKQEFLERCMSNETMRQEYSDQDQRYAVCNSQWRNSKKKELLEAFCEGNIEKERELTEELEKEQYSCECLDCGHKVTSDKHCRDFKCPKCGGEMRRANRPGVGSRS